MNRRFRVGLSKRWVDSALALGGRKKDQMARVFVCMCVCEQGKLINPSICLIEFGFPDSFGDGHTEENYLFQRALQVKVAT